jgi:serine/threonine-protein kinase
MAPERFSSQPYDGKSDVYSLGITLYQMLSGRLPFVTPHRDPLAMAMMQRNEAPPPLPVLDPPVPEALQAVLQQALRKDAAERPGAEDLARLLVQVVGLPTRSAAAPAPPTEKAPPSPEGRAVATDRPSPGGPRSPRRH